MFRIIIMSIYMNDKNGLIQDIILLIFFLKKPKIFKVLIQTETIDNYCKIKNKNIDILKIDVGDRSRRNFRC